MVEDDGELECAAGNFGFAEVTELGLEVDEVGD